MLTDPALDAILGYCAGDPIERVFLEDVARRGIARFRAVEGEEGLAALCYFGANVVPSGEGCEAFAVEASVRGTRMIIGEEAAVTDLWARGPVGHARAAGGSSRPARVRDRGTAQRAIQAACARRRPRISTCCCPRARRRITRSSASTRWSATRTGSAGERCRRSRRGDPGSGPKMGRSSSRPRPPRGLRAPCSSSRCGSIRACAGRATRRAGSPTCAGSSRADAVGVPLRPSRERAGHPPLREDRNAARRHVPEPALLT